jgi:hypothetical protein
MKLVKTASRWGNVYNFRYFIDGIRISESIFDITYRKKGLTPEAGVMENTDFGFRKIWFC